MNISYYNQYHKLLKINLNKIDVFRTIKEWCIGKEKILDWGCGIGYLTNYLNAVGVDVNEYAIQQARRLYPNRRFFLNTKLNEKFDVIICYNVLEHLSDETRKNVFIEFKNLLNKDGFIIFGFVNLYHPLERLIAFVRGDTALNDPTHVHNWTLDEFREVIEKDFKVFEEKKVSQFSQFIFITKYIKASLLLKCMQNKL